MHTSFNLCRLALVTILVSACGDRGEDPCLAATPGSFDFVIFDENGNNYAENLPRVFTFSTKEKKSYIDIKVLPGPRTAYLSSSDVPLKSLSGEKTFILAWGLENKEDTLFVDVVAGEGCVAPRYQAVRLNGKPATFEYGVGPIGAYIFRK